MARRLQTDVAVSVRSARAADAPAMGRVYVAAWRETYPALLPMPALLSMCDSRSARQFEVMVARNRDTALVAESPGRGIVGLATGGRASDRGLRVGERPVHGEVFTLYVDPMATGCGVGGRLLREILSALAEQGHKNAVAWVLKGNPARFFYEHLGAKLIASKREQRFGTNIEIEAYAWPDLARVMMRPSTS